MLKKIGVGMQMVLAFILMSVISIVLQLSVTTKLVSESTTRDALSLLDEMSSRYSSEMNGFLERGITLANDARAVITGSRDIGTKRQLPPDREGTLIQVENILRANSFPIGLWTAWEPNMFDGRDAYFVNHAGHDTSGRFVPYIFNTNGQIVVEPLVDYDKSGAGDYYQIALKTGRNIILEPYTYNVGGKDVLLTTMTVPVMENNKVIGAVGTDVSLGYITERMSAIKPMGVGQVILISPGGVIVGHSDPSMVGKKFSDTPRGRLLKNEIDMVINTKKAVTQVVTGGWIDG